VRNVAITDIGQIIENNSIHHLLTQLNREVFILDTKETVDESINAGSYKLHRMDDHTLEVEIERGQSMNALFDDLSRQNIHVVSMRNKANRLEELFVSLVDGNKK